MIDREQSEHERARDRQRRRRGAAAQRERRRRCECQRKRERTRRRIGPQGDPDHNVVLAVRGQWGYMYYVDNVFMGWPKGSDEAPYVNEKYTDFPPGVGVPLPLYRQLLIEFMTTGERPTGVDWYCEADLFHSWRDQQMSLRGTENR